MYKLGWTQFLPFIITIIAIVATDLLIGIGIGLVVSILFILKSTYVKSFWMRTTEEDGRKTYNMTLVGKLWHTGKSTLASPQGHGTGAISAKPLLDIRQLGRFQTSVMIRQL